jgi:hypothetical protein
VSGEELETAFHVDVNDQHYDDPLLEGAWVPATQASIVFNG